jgi:geranylgeranyl diphosphate synthase type II
MNLYSREQESFEAFCRAEFQQIFRETAQSVVGAAATIDKIQSSSLSESGGAAGDLSVYNSQFESIEYSYFSGGKRFRPLLSFAGAHYLGVSLESVFPWAMAIEMIHTYSLIHDDLPCMDNDDFRRGKPTNHKVYGEAIALLAGDSLLTEAFSVLAKHYAGLGPNLSLLVQQLAHSSGLNGMILGQYFDVTLASGKISATPAHLNQIHLLKTGALISGALMGPALLKRLSADQLKSMQEVGSLLGYAFQVKDDILDSEQDKDSKKNLIHHFKTVDKLEGFLNQIHARISAKISSLDKLLQISSEDPSAQSQHLLQFLEWNIIREK